MSVYDDVALLQTQMTEAQEKITALEAKTNDSGWITLTLQNGVIPYSENSTPKYRKIGNKVLVKGTVKNVNGACVIGNLPAGFRPITHSHPYVQNTTYSGGANVSRIVIQTNGNIEIEGISHNASWGADKWFPLHTEFIAE